MGRNKNMLVREAIQMKAYELFRNNGYQKTAMSQIAMACGIDKTLIQYYFPKKELLVQDYLRRLLELSAEACQINKVGQEIDLGGFYRMGIIYFAYLLDHKKFSIDIFADRKLTNQIIDMNITYAKNYLSELKLDPQKAEEEIIMAMGGAYELLYRYMTQDIAVSGEKIIGKIVTSFILGMGGTMVEAGELKEQHKMTEKEITSKIKYVNTKFI